MIVTGERQWIVDICETAMLAVLIAVSGVFRIPGLVPGTEFQLSAPIAVAICGVFGFKKYLIAGILASLLSMTMGTATILNVAVAMTFRVVVGLVWLAPWEAPLPASSCTSSWGRGLKSCSSQPLLA